MKHMNYTKTSLRFNAFYSFTRYRLLITCLFFSILSVQPAWSEEAVGQVTLVIGDAHLQKNEHAQVSVSNGIFIYSGDQIVTRANGHVHIRFNDQGLLSIRPNSHLTIKHYEFNSQNPSQSTVKFNLEKGVARSVSGEAATAARERFRMNTPIAAIGVRGTDFVVSANNSSIRAIVNEGSIVVAPFSADCNIDALGPCSANAVELKSGTNQFIELNRMQQTPQLQPIHNQALPESILQHDDKQPIQTDNEENSSTDMLYNESIAHRTLSLSVQAQPAATTPDFTSNIPIESDVLKSKQLLWGRWSETVASQDTLTLPYSEATQDRNITVGNNHYGLFRLTRDTERVQPGLGSISFDLMAAQADFTSNSVSSAMKVNGGDLHIDFNSNIFSTNLQLNHSSTGNINFNATGKLYDGGYFHSRTATQTLGGAVSLDGSEAGYFFSKQLNNGQINGITLWENP